MIGLKRFNNGNPFNDVTLFSFWCTNNEITNSPLDSETSGSLQHNHVGRGFVSIHLIQPSTPFYKTVYKIRYLLFGLRAH